METNKSEPYSIADATERLKCQPKDIARWGAANKLEVCVFFKGRVETGSLAFERNSAEQLFIPEEDYEMEGLMPLKEHNLLNLYQANESAERNDMQVEIPEFKTEKDRYIKIIPNDFSEVSKPNPFKIGYNELYVTGQELNRFQSALDTHDAESPLPAYLDPTNHFHAPELEIAVKAWQGIYGITDVKIPPGGHVKHIKKWPKTNQPDLSARALARITTVINPNPKGGASTTPQKFLEKPCPLSTT